MTGSGGSIQWNLYVRVGDRLVAQRIDYTPPGGGASSIAMRYFTTDHLGSVAVITDELGAVVERLSFDAWGKRRHPDGTDDPSGSITSQTTRGFTGHEMIDEVGLVNMNGRVYDPEIGRFMSADPFVQDPTNTQSLNRYSYVGNNPLSYTDPSGYFLKKIWKTLAAVVIMVVAVVFGQYWVAGALGLEAGGVAALAIAGAVGGAIAGGITGGGNLRSILTGAITGAAGAGFGAAAKLGHITVTQKVVAIGMTGGVTSVIQGGNFQSGFLAAGFSAIAAPLIDKVANDNILIGAAGSAVVGGAASVLGGGKFENGAVTGAFSYAAGRVAEEIVEAKERATSAAEEPLAFAPAVPAAIAACARLKPCRDAAIVATVTLAEEARRLDGLRVHGNSNQSQRETEVYYLRNRDSLQIDKIGITSDPATRYTDAYLRSENVFYETQYRYSSRYPAVVDENIRLFHYRVEHGDLPRLNKLTR